MGVTSCTCSLLGFALPLRGASEACKRPQCVPLSALPVSTTAGLCYTHLSPGCRCAESRHLLVLHCRAAGNLFCRFHRCFFDPRHAEDRGKRSPAFARTPVCRERARPLPEPCDMPPTNSPVSPRFGATAYLENERLLHEYISIII